MNYRVYLTKRAEKTFHRIPKHILVLLDLWIEIIETEGFHAMQLIKGYRDHSLKGNRKGQRSSSLNKSWRVIYMLNEQTNELIIEVLEVNNHDY